MALKSYDLPWPTKGLNLDAPPTDLDAREAYRLDNMIVTDREVRLRAPVGYNVNRYYGNVMSSTSADTVLGVRSITRGTASDIFSAVSLLRPTYALNASDQPYYTGGLYSTFTGTPLVLRSTGLHESYTAVATGVSNLLGDVRVWGRCIQIGDSVYGVSFDDVACGSRYGVFDQGTRVMQWSGASLPTVTLALNASGLALGSRTLTLSASYGTSLVGSIMTVGTSDVYDNQRWNYVVESHSGANVTLSRPWGLGDPSVTSVAAGANIMFRAQAPVFQAPWACAAVEHHLGRLWVGRGYLPVSSTVSQFSPALLMWSYPNNPSNFPSTNYMYVDPESSDPIMGLSSCNEGLLVFKKQRTYIILGYDEGSFRIRLVSSSVGLMHSSSICRVDDDVYWYSEQGVMRFRGGRIDNMSSRSPGVGIQSALVEENRTGHDVVASGGGIPQIEALGDRLYVTNSTVLQNTSRPIWVLERNDGVWSRMTIGDGQSTAGAYRKLGVLHKYGSELIAFTSDGAYDMSECYDVQFWHGNSDFDALFDPASGAYNTPKILGEITQVSVPGDSDTVRLRAVDVAHICQDFSGGYALYDVKVTPNFGAGTQGTVGTINTRGLGATIPNRTIPYYDRLTSTSVPFEGARFAVTLSRRVDAAYISAGVSSSVTRLRLHFDPQTVRVGWIDPTATAQ